MSTVINVRQDTVSVDVKSVDVTLDIVSGGIVPANIDTVLEAAESISALRAITTDGSGKAVYATNATASGSVVIGISTTSGSTGANINIQTAGTLTDASWSWSKGLIWLGTNGALTQTVPTNGAYAVPIAKAITATTIIIDVDTSIQTV